MAKKIKNATLNREEILDVLLNIQRKNGTIGEDDTDLDLSELCWNENYENDVVDIEKVEDFGGEGMGDTTYFVLKIGHNQYIKFTGSYDSWNGTEWYDGNEFDFVEPVQVMKTIYNKIKG